MHLSSATVYGAWPDNQIPLTEDSPLRPNPEFAYAVGKAEAERALAEWAEDHPDTRVAVLRPAVTVGSPEPLYEALGATRAPGAGDGRRPVQYLHVDDLADAVILAWERRLSGVYNVAPDTGRARGRRPGPGRRGGQGHPAAAAGPRRGRLDLAAVAPGRSGRGAGLRHPSLGHRPGPPESGRLDARTTRAKRRWSQPTCGCTGTTCRPGAARTTTCCSSSAPPLAPWPAVAGGRRWRPGGRRAPAGADRQSGP